MDMHTEKMTEAELRRHITILLALRRQHKPEGLTWVKLSDELYDAHHTLHDKGLDNAPECPFCGAPEMYKDAHKLNIRALKVYTEDGHAHSKCLLCNRWYEDI